MESKHLKLRDDSMIWRCLCSG